jgi:hypothetical protein
MSKTQPPKKGFFRNVHVTVFLFFSDTVSANNNPVLVEYIALLL